MWGFEMFETIDYCLICNIELESGEYWHCKDCNIDIDIETMDADNFNYDAYGE